MISISDREGDIDEVFEAWQKLDGDGPRAEWLIRANQDRVLLGIEDGESFITPISGGLWRLSASCCPDATMFAEYPRAQASYWVPNLAMALDHKKLSVMTCGSR